MLELYFDSVIFRLNLIYIVHTDMSNVTDKSSVKPKVDDGIYQQVVNKLSTIN